jgi:hypothetical protein
MNAAELILHFMEQIVDDPTMGPSHIGLYLAIVMAYERQGCLNPVSVYSRGLMRVAKVSAAGTYSKCMRDLQAAGHIRYIQSYNPALGSLVYLKEAKNEGYETCGAGVATGKRRG